MCKSKTSGLILKCAITKFCGGKKILCLLLISVVLWMTIHHIREDVTQQPQLFLPKPVTEIRCSALFANDEDEMQRAFDWMNTKDALNNVMNDSDLSNVDCTRFLQQRQYVMHSLSQEEADFPLAFSLVINKDVAQFERLLRAIYRPQNAYCIHVDLKAKSEVHKSVHRLAGCFPARNVLVVAEPVDVRWGEYSVLQADLICFKELLNKFPYWKYIINLTGQEFPLKTHREIVRILSILNGANSMEGTVRRRNEYRVPQVKVDFPVTWFKGSVHVIATRSFVDFIFTNPKAQKIHEIVKKSYVPDEQFFSTLNHNPQLGTPGAYLGLPAETDQKTYHFITRLKNWNDEPFKYPCQSKRWVRQICIWGVRDLQFIAQRFELFVNKFYWNTERLALDCMEQRFWERTYRDYHSMHQLKPDLDLNETFYKDLAIVKLHQ